MATNSVTVCRDQVFNNGSAIDDGIKRKFCTQEVVNTCNGQEGVGQEICIASSVKRAIGLSDETQKYQWMQRAQSKISDRTRAGGGASAPVPTASGDVLEAQLGGAASPSPAAPAVGGAPKTLAELINGQCVGLVGEAMTACANAVIVKGQTFLTGAAAVAGAAGGQSSGGRVTNVRDRVYAEVAASVGAGWADIGSSHSGSSAPGRTTAGSSHATGGGNGDSAATSRLAIFRPVAVDGRFYYIGKEGVVVGVGGRFVFIPGYKPDGLQSNVATNGNAYIAGGYLFLGYAFDQVMLSVDAGYSNATFNGTFWRGFEGRVVDSSQHAIATGVDITWYLARWFGIRGGVKAEFAVRRGDCGGRPGTCGFPYQNVQGEVGLVFRTPRASDAEIKAREDARKAAAKKAAGDSK